MHTHIHTYRWKNLRGILIFVHNMSTLSLYSTKFLKVWSITFIFHYDIIKTIKCRCFYAFRIWEVWLLTCIWREYLILFIDFLKIRKQSGRTHLHRCLQLVIGIKHWLMFVNKIFSFQIFRVILIFLLHKWPYVSQCWNTSFSHR